LPVTSPFLLAISTFQLLDGAVQAVDAAPPPMNAGAVAAKILEALGMIYHWVNHIICSNPPKRQKTSSLYFSRI